MAFHVTVAFSVFLHAGALAWATVHTLVQVQELPAPSVKLSFIYAPPLAPAVAPPAPKPPEAPKGVETARAPQAQARNLRRQLEQTMKDALTPKPAVVEAPADEQILTQPTPQEATPTVVDNAAGTGTGGGIAGGDGKGAGSGNWGKAPGIAGGAPPPRILPESLGKLQRLSGEAPIFPAQLAKQGARFLVMAKVCVNTRGAIDSIDLIKRADPLLDNSVSQTVKGWRYRPLLAGETAVPFCTFVRFEFSAES